MVRFRRPVLAAWLVLLVAGVTLSLLLPAHLATSFAVPGTDSDRADSALARGFGERPEGTFTVVFRVRHSSDATVQRGLRARLEAAAGTLPGGRLETFRAGAGVVYGDIATNLSLQRAKEYTSSLRRALRSAGGPTALVTGQPAVQHDLDPKLASDLRRGEMLAVPLALLVLAFVLGISLALAIPFVFAACSIAGTLALLFVVSHLVSVTSYATNLVGLVGLGLAVDYSLLVVCRYREELETGVPREIAIVRTMAGAGRAVVFSGLAVTIGLALLLFVPGAVRPHDGFGRPADPARLDRRGVDTAAGAPLVLRARVFARVRLRRAHAGPGSRGLRSPVPSCAALSPCSCRPSCCCSQPRRRRSSSG